MRPDQISAHIVRALQAVGYSQREAARMLAEHDAAVLLAAADAVADPEERRRTTVGLGLGWEAAHQVLIRRAEELGAPAEGRAAA